MLRRERWLVWMMTRGSADIRLKLQMQSLVRIMPHRKVSFWRLGWEDRVAFQRLHELRLLCGRVMGRGNAGEMGVSGGRWVRI
ncbi:hypothetical protein E2C01_047687 [Portunus trituberculatus]|uniref:Uncharacterized protein n=1 Tax=Portunus trituberculatus TaxID=210409 RepID=A0A5B7G8F5_PORTR|nr:hypothetical protein [Portunus trituberculatus]